MPILNNVATIGSSVSQTARTLTGVTQVTSGMFSGSTNSPTDIRGSSVNGLTNVGTGVLNSIPGVASGIGSAAASIGALGAITGSSGLTKAAGQIGMVAAGIAGVASAVGSIMGAVNQVAGLLGGNTATIGGASGSGTQSNPLHAYASYNYLFGLYCLSDGEVNGGSRGNGTGIPIIVDAVGDGTPIGATTFIDDVRIQGNMGLDGQAGNSNAFAISFKVIEPYSMGKFWESLQAAAQAANHQNYVQAPFMLTIQFKGHFGPDEPFQTIPYTNKYIHMKIRDVQMKVGKRGAEYQIEAYPWNEGGMSTSFSEIKTDANISCNKGGPYKVKDLLKFAEKSLKETINKKLKDDKDRKKTVTYAHEIDIVFPPAPYTTNTDGNIIGESDLGLSQYNRADSPFAKEGATYENGIYKRGEIQIDTKNGDFKFAKGSTVQDIINQVILSSDYGRKALENPGDKVTWWRIETHYHNISTEDPKTGEKAKKVIFRVVPYLVDTAVFFPPNTTTAPPAVVRELNYLYMGDNHDILDWNIFYNIGFYKSFSADGGANSEDKNLAGRSGNAMPSKSGGAPPEAEPPGSIGPEVARRDKNQTKTALFGGASFDDAATNAARQFHDIATRSEDMINLDLTILGDPYFLGDSGHGNFTIAGSGPMNSEGSINWQEGYTYIKLGFRMPEDVNTETGYYDFAGGSKPMREFSGYYQVQGVESTFSRGKFTQKLQLIKKTGVVDPGAGFLPPKEASPDSSSIWYP